VSPAGRIEDLTLAELDELRELTGGADPTEGDFWGNVTALYGFAFLLGRRDDPTLTWETVRGWPLGDVYGRLGAESDPTTPPGTGGSENGHASPTPSTSPQPTSAR
jgi:hypothetical protein